MKHAHRYRFDSFEKNGHKHRIMGITGYNIFFCFSHVHFYKGVCSYNGHTHYFSGFSGLPRKTENGHYHQMSGYLVMCDKHEHRYCNFSNENIEYTGDNKELNIAVNTK